MVKNNRFTQVGFFVLLCWICAGSWADQTDERLNDLFGKLEQAADITELGQIEAQIWSIWLESGEDPVNAILGQGTEAMRLGDFPSAVAHFDRVIAMRPQFAEGWNKRATANYLRDQLHASMQDVQRTLALEPRHFGALSGMGLIFMRRGDLNNALDAFQEVLKVHPNSPSAKSYVELLRKQLGQQLI